MFMKCKWEAERCEGHTRTCILYKTRQERLSPAVEFTDEKKTLAFATARVQLGEDCLIFLAHWAWRRSTQWTHSPFISWLSCLLPPPAPAWLIIWALKILIFASSRTTIRESSEARAEWNSGSPAPFSLSFCRWQLSHITRSGGVSERLTFWEYLRPNYFTCRLLHMSGVQKNFNALQF